MFNNVILSQAKRLAAAAAAVGAVAAAPAFAVDFDSTTAPLPTDQRVLVTPSERAAAAKPIAATAGGASAALSFDGISSVAALPTDQRVSRTPSEQAAAQRAVQRRIVPAAVSGPTIVSAPLPTDQRIN